MTLSCFKTSVSGPIRELWFACSEVRWVPRRSETKSHTGCASSRAPLGPEGLRLPWFGQHAGQGSADCPSTEIGDVSHDKPGMTGLGRSAAFLSMSRPRTVPWLILKTWPGSPGYGVLVSVSRHLCFLEVALQPTPRLEHPLEGAAPMGAWVLSGRSRLTTDDDNLYAQRFPASSVLAREGAGCGSVGDVPGAWLASAPLSPSLWT